MVKYIVDFWMDGYDSEEEMAEEGVSVIYDQLESSGTSVDVKRFEGNTELKELLDELELLDRIGISWDSNLDIVEVFEVPHNAEYARLKHIEALIKKYRAKL